jgi:hypothetical protein
MNAAIDRILRVVAIDKGAVHRAPLARAQGGRELPPGTNAALGAIS